MRRTVWVVAVAMVATVIGAWGGISSAATLGPNVVVNGGFERGTLGGWTTAGASIGVGAGRTGTYAARLGTTTATNGDSTMFQTVAVPANATLSFWYQPHCPDTVAHDQEQAQIRNASGAVLVTVLNTCSNSGVWTHAVRNLSAFAGQSIVLWFNNHDDNVAADPTYTLFDDVSVRGATAVDDFSISASPTSVSAAQGGNAVTTISTAVTSGSAQQVSLSASGLPSGSGASFSPAIVTAGASATMTITTSASTPRGTATLTVTGTGTSATHTTAVSLTVTPPPPPTLLQVSTDPYTTTSSQHATEVEPDTLSVGSTIVSVFQVGRFTTGGSNDIGWATTTNGGQSWAHGFLPGITTSQGGGIWARVSDPSVGYDAKHGVWVAAGLVLDSSAIGRGVLVNRSTDGLNWANAVTAVTTTTAFFDKSWIVCDSTPTSAHYGNCYIEYDNNSSGNRIQMLTSTDGGLTWSSARQPADAAAGLGGQPVVQPNGTVVVPYFADVSSQIRSFVSTDGGTTWAASVAIATQTDHGAAGGLRTEPLPSAEIDAAGTVYVTWQDCKFRSGCSANDIVLATSTTGSAWTAVQRIPIDPVTSTVDHFIPGLAVDRSTSGASARLGLYYYYYPTASCSTASCQLDVGYVSSANGGATWSAPTQVAGPMTMAQIAATSQGPMVGDYISASFVAGRAYSVFAVGLPLSGTVFNEAMYTVVGGMGAPGGTAPAIRSTMTPTPVPAGVPPAPVTAY